MAKELDALPIPDPPVIDKVALADSLAAACAQKLKDSETVYFALKDLGALNPEITAKVDAQLSTARTLITALVQKVVP